jgi:signal peptide peptidase SppA
MPDCIEGVIAQREAAAANISPIEAKLEIENALSRASTRFKNVKGDIAVLPVRGFISHRMTIWAALGFEASSEMFGKWLDAAMADASIGSIIIDINSPGGTVHGLTAISDKIFAARGKKPIIAVSNSLMASAAYFLGSAADEIVADPDSLTGSIGSVAVHVEQSKMLEGLGIKATIIRSAEFKYEGNSIEPLTEQARARIQSDINSFAATFINAVARNRKTTATNVKANFGKGGVFRAEEAVAAGMVDRVATLEQVIDRVRSDESPTNSRNRNRMARNTVAVKQAIAKQMQMT